jgi:hypothetical protein
MLALIASTGDCKDKKKLTIRELTGILTSCLKPVGIYSASKNPISGTNSDPPYGETDL